LFSIGKISKLSITLKKRKISILDFNPIPKMGRKVLGMSRFIKHQNLTPLEV
jgi:hypothetical protein